MPLCCLLGYFLDLANGCIGEPLGYQKKNLPLGRRERFILSQKLCALAILLALSLVLQNRFPDNLKKLAGFRRLDKKIDRPVLHCFHGHLDVAMR